LGNDGDAGCGVSGCAVASLFQESAGQKGRGKCKERIAYKTSLFILFSFFYYK